MQVSRRLALVALASVLFAGGQVARPFDLSPLAASAREAQAVPGTFVSSLTLQNPSGGDAIAAVRFVDANGNSALPNPLTVTVPAGGSALVYVPNVPGLADGKYSAVVDSTTQLFLISNLLSSNPTTASSYNGFNQSDAGTSFYVPSVYKSYVGLYTSTIVVQNADASNPAAVRVEYRDASGNVAATDQATIAASASFTFDQDNAAALPAGFVGSAVVTSDRNVGAIFNVSDPINKQFSSSNGFKDGAPIAYLPVIYNNYSAAQWVTSFLVQNVDTATADVEVNYSDGRTSAATLAPGSSRLYYQGNDGTPSGFNGSAVVRSPSGKKIVAVANIRNGEGNLSAYNGFTSGTKSVSLPVIYNNYSSLGWTTSFTIQNVDSVATDLTITFSNNQTKTVTGLQPGQSALLYQPNDGLPSGFNGSVNVSSTAAKIVGVVNELSLNKPNAGDWLLTYDGFNR